MKLNTGLFLLLTLFAAQSASAQDVLRGEVKIEREPIYGAEVDTQYPLDNETAYRRALEMSALLFSAQIYGWSFQYDTGEKARRIAEEFTLTPLGEIRRGDSALKVTHARFDGSVLSVWADYRPGDAQLRRLAMWNMGNVRTAQASGYWPLGGGESSEAEAWLAVRKSALEDCARAAVRAMLRVSERNRPKEVKGFISLQGFPVFAISAGRWTANARFRVRIEEIVPFAAY